MDWIRPKEIQKQQARAQVLLELPSTAVCAERSQALIQECFKPDPTHLVPVAPEVIQDAQVVPWLTRHSTISTGTRAWLSAQIAHPIHSIPLLQRRQKDLKALGGGAIPPVLTDYEADMLWAIHLPPLDKAWPLQFLFPQWWVLRWINRFSPLLQFYQLYRIFGTPLIQILYPLSILIGPWWYVRTKLGMKLPFASYLQFIKKALVELLRFRSGNVWEIVVKLTTLGVYFGVYLYGWIQTIDLSRMLWTVRQGLLERLSHIQTFIITVESHWRASGLSLSTWGLKEPGGEEKPPLPNTLSGIYQLFRSNAFHDLLKTRLLQFYTLQGITSVSQASSFTFVRYVPTGLIRIKGMGHPMLAADQQRNPVDLKKHLILTGPNAAGKSTYVRGILANLLFAQTFGVALAQRAILTPIRRIVSMMRVQDTIGSQSLFEAECRRAMDLIRTAQEEREGPIVFFLDEPMQATPPIEGSATAMALLRYLSRFPHVRLIATTHYHGLAELDKSGFQNVSMDAAETDPIRFTYKLKPGPCFQSIALEMLKKDAFPEELLEDAIKIKNKLYGLENNTK
jgi:MutS domain V